MSKEDRPRSLQQDLYVKPERAGPNVAKVQAHNIVEPYAAPSVYLPKACDPWFCFEHAPTMPQIVLLALISQRRPRPDQRHVAFKNVDELREFVEAGVPEEVAYFRDAWIILHLIDGFFPVSVLALVLSMDHALHELFMNAQVVVYVHGAKFQEGEAFS